MTSTTATSNEPAEYAQGRCVYGQVFAVGTAQEKEGKVMMGGQPVVVAALSESDEQQLAKKWRQREQYRISSLVLVVLTLVTALGTIAAAAVVFHDTSIYHDPTSDSSALNVLGTVLAYIFVMVESILCTVTAVVLLVYLCRRPESVLLRAPFDQGKFVCLCISLVLLALFAGYSFAVPIFLKALNADPSEPVALCVIPGVRVVALLSLTGVLIAHRQLR